RVDSRVARRPGRPGVVDCRDHGRARRGPARGLQAGAMAVNRIRRLAPALANQIAAGEVVERPAAAVPERAEHAADAGARRIHITMAFGGTKRLVVEDGGAGMSPAGAELAIERRATSKLSQASDLAAIRTLGFRGEALPSIASVSHF